MNPRQLSIETGEALEQQLLENLQLFIEETMHYPGYASCQVHGVACYDYMDAVSCISLQSHSTSILRWNHKLS